MEGSTLMTIAYSKRKKNGTYIANKSQAHLFLMQYNFILIKITGKIHADLVEIHLTRMNNLIWKLEFVSNGIVEKYRMVELKEAVKTVYDYRKYILYQLNGSAHFLS